MFLKKNSGYKGRTYLTISRGYRDVDGKVKHKHVHNLGYLDELQKEYPDPVSHFKELAKQMTIAENDALNTEVNIFIKNNEDITASFQRKNLGYSILKKIYNELNLKEFFQNAQSTLNVDYDLNSIFELLIYSRIMYPGSKKLTFENKNIFFDKFDFSLKDLYRALDHFSSFKKDIESWIWKNTKDPYERDASTAYYDCTNYYFEVSYNDEDLIDEEGNILEKGYRKKGPSKEHKPSPIIGMGLLMDKNGIPLSYDLFPGNESEKTTLRPILRRTKSDFGLNKIITVADRGLNTSDNTIFTAGKNDNYTNKDGYVFGQSILGADDEFKNWVLKQDDYLVDLLKDDNDNKVIFKHKSRVYAKNVTIQKNGKRTVQSKVYQKQMVYYSEKYARKQKKERDLILAKAQDLIANPFKYNKATSYGASKYIDNIKFDKDTGVIVEGATLSLKISKIKDEEKFDGYYSIVTSEKHLSDKEIRDIYKGLWKIEETFKITKSNFKSRPVYVWAKEHIEAHFLTCFVSLVIVRLLEQKIEGKFSTGKIINSLKKYSCSYVQENYYLFDYRDEVIETLENTFNVNFRKKYRTLSNIKKFL